MITWRNISWYIFHFNFLREIFYVYISLHWLLALCILAITWLGSGFSSSRKLMELSKRTLFTTSALRTFLLRKPDWLCGVEGQIFYLVLCLFYFHSFWVHFPIGKPPGNMEASHVWRYPSYYPTETRLRPELYLIQISCYPHVCLLICVDRRCVFVLRTCWHWFLFVEYIKWNSH